MATPIINLLPSLDQEDIANGFLDIFRDLSDNKLDPLAPGVFSNATSLVTL